MTVTPITGTLTDHGDGTGSIAWTSDGTTPPVVPPNHDGTDAIDFSQAVITRDSPDVRGWSIGARLTSLTLSATDHANLEFTKRNGADAWPFVNGPEGGEIQYTLWVGCLIDGLWYFCGSILCISRSPDDNYVPTGPTLQVGQLPNNWYYFCGDPLQEYQPQPGEPVAWLLTAGVQRRNDIHRIVERTQVVLAPFSPGMFTF
jgi:hypothetical protein